MSKTNIPSAVADTQSTSTDCCLSGGGSPACDKFAMLAGSVLLRAWLGVRTVQSGIEKFATNTLVERPQMADGEPTGLVETVSMKTYQLSAYKGIPDALKSVFADQPMIPGFMLPIYNAVLGPALIILGLTVLLGIASRVSLLLMGLLYVSLTWGLVIWGEPGNAGVAYLGTHIVLIVMALHLTRHDCLRVLKKW